MTIVYGLVSREKTVLAEYTATLGKCTIVTEWSWLEAEKSERGILYPTPRDDGLFGYAI